MKGGFAPGSAKGAEKRIGNADRVGKKAEKEVSQTEFLSFLEPFLATMTLGHFKSILDGGAQQQAKIDPDVYARFSKDLKRRILNCYIFDQKTPLDDRTFETELRPKAEIPSITPFTTEFFVKHDVLDEFRGPVSPVVEEKLGGLWREKKRLCEAICQAIIERAKIHGYFQIREQIQKGLDSVHNKMKARRKKQYEEAELEFIKEYLDRMDEFYAEFGTPDQFGYDALIFPDLLTAERGFAQPDFTYLP